jgi:UDP-glucose 4-epimerase
VVKGDVKHTSADTSKAKEILGYEPEVEFEEGLELEVKFLKKLYE